MGLRTVALLGIIALKLFVEWSPVEAQPAAHRIGLLYFTRQQGAEPFLKAFREGLRTHGWIEGKNLIIDYRFAGGKVERVEKLAAELVRLEPEVMVTATTTATAIAMRATKTIPIVFVFVADPVGSGFVDSLSRPGRNATGPSTMAPDLTSKQLELLKEVVPELSRLAVFWEPTNPGVTLTFHKMRRDMRKLGVMLQSQEVRRPDDFTTAFAAMRKERPEAILALLAPLTVRHGDQIATFASSNGLPAMATWQGFVETGGLMSYGANFLDYLRRAGPYVDKILKGANPADLPVEQPTQFELFINLKTARQLGITIPPSVLFRATKVIK